MNQSEDAQIRLLERFSSEAGEVVFIEVGNDLAIVHSLRLSILTNDLGCAGGKTTPKNARDMQILSYSQNKNVDPAFHCTL